MSLCGAAGRSSCDAAATPPEPPAPPCWSAPAAPPTAPPAASPSPTVPFPAPAELLCHVSAARRADAAARRASDAWCAALPLRSRRGACGRVPRPRACGDQCGLRTPPVRGAPPAPPPCCCLALPRGGRGRCGFRGDSSCRRPWCCCCPCCCCPCCCSCSVGRSRSCCCACCWS